VGAERWHGGAFPEGQRAEQGGAEAMGAGELALVLASMLLDALRESEDS